MTVLLINKFLFPNAGTETAYFATRSLLVDHGYDVSDFGMADERNAAFTQTKHLAPHRNYADDQPLASRISDGAASIYSFSSRRSLSALLRSTPVEVAHVHNAYHQLSLSVLDTLHRAGVPTVMTVHDWKIACPAYNLFRDGAPCRQCVGRRVPTPAIRGRCVKGSSVGSAIATAEAALVRTRRLYDRVDRFIAPSDFAAEVLAMEGIPDDRIDVIPNFVADTTLGREAWSGRARVLYAGRLEDEKGVRQLLTAMEASTGDGELVVAGVGPLEKAVEDAARRDPRIRYVGRVTPSHVLELIDESSAICLFAQWEENCPMIVLEAKSRGRAAIVSTRGGLDGLVSDDTGWRVPADSVAALSSSLEDVFRGGPHIARKGEAARADYEKRFTPASHLQRLTDTYEKAMRR